MSCDDGFDDSPADLVTITSQAIIAPDLAGLDQTGAENALISAGLSLGTVVETENDAPAGQVLAQDPAAGTELESGAAVDLTVSLGPPMAAAPDVVGLTQTEAQTVITSAGFVVGTSTGIYSETIPEDQVMYQSPAAGTQAVLGSAVNLIISDGPDPTPDTEAPTVAITLPAVQANIGSSIAIEVTVHDNRGVTDLTVEVNGLSQSVDAGQVIFTPTEIGRCYVTASAVDAAGNQGEAGAWFDAVDPGDATPPSINLTAPSDGHEITAPTEITGEINDTQLDTWIVEYRRVESTDWIRLAEGDEPVSGVLTVFDPTLLKNGLYEIRVRAEDKIGNADSAYLTAFVDGQLKVGLNQVAFTDLRVPVSGINITVIRAYNAGDKRSKDFGHGWSAAVSDLDLMESRAMGDGWYEENVGSFLPQWEIQADEVHLVVVIWPDGRSEAFDMRAEYTDPVYRTGGEVQISFVPREGTTSTLEPVNSQLLLYNAGEIIGSDDLDPFDPDQYVLTTREGWTYTIHDLDGLEKAVDPNGNSLTIDSGGVVHSSGKSIVFQRDSANRITTITDPAGADLVYEYDQNGDLIRFTDQEGRSAEYTYDDDHNLLEIYDPRGVPALECEYDESGRLIATIDANGERVGMNHDLTSYTSTATDRRGFQTTFTYNEQGWVTQKRDHYGYITSYTYDSRGNKLSETNPLGNKTTYTYDQWDNISTVADPLGNTKSFTYNDLNQIVTLTDPLGRVTTTSYDQNGNATSVSNPLDYIVSNSYDSDGRPLTFTDALGAASTFEYDEFGNTVKQTDPLGNVISKTFDENGKVLTVTLSRTTDSTAVDMTTTMIRDSVGRVVTTIDPDGAETRFEYNEIDKITAEVDKLGHRTEYEYDLAGNLIRTIYPDGSEESTTYDAEGNRTSVTDRAGRTTTFEYDYLGRLISTTHPDGSSRTDQYDAAGRIVSSIDENGNETAFTYDAAGRRTSIIDPLGDTTVFTCDSAGNVVSTTDANNHTITNEYDDLNRLTRVVFPDNSSKSYAYDGDGRKTSETDQAGLTTQFTYDAVGRLIKILDATGGETLYGYDEIGNRISQTNANGYTTSWTYDNFGRVLSRTLPLGMSEIFAYDANGNLTSHTDFMGRTTGYLYDANNWLIYKTYPDGSGVAYTYTADGRRKTVVDSQGEISYSYDPRGRLARVDNPDGSYLAYTYDSAGNRTSVAAPNSSTSFSYDRLNRLSATTDPDGGATAYTYDGVGNRSSVTYPNGAVAQYAYDSLNRLTNLDNLTATGETISSYAYTLDSAGNRTSVVESNGRTVNYTYDDLYRLITEEILDPNDGAETISYTYDAFGNRLTRADAADIIDYAYDKNDRLLSEIGSAVNTTYSYDANGNTTSRTTADVSTGSLTTEYNYDYEDRLVQSYDGQTLCSYAYDADGVRVAKWVDSELTGYLVDKNRPYAQVLEETDGVGALQVEYVHGDDLISQNRGGVKRYYHYDGQSSTRQLSDDSGTIQDEYNYDAFGILRNQTGSTSNSYLYTGEQFDANLGLYYLRARYYNQSAGRFINMDRFGGMTEDPLSLHKYLYANANPINYHDPSGYTSASLSGHLTTLGVISILSGSAYSSYRASIMGETSWEEVSSNLFIGALAGASCYMTMCTLGVPLSSIFGVSSQVVIRYLVMSLAFTDIYSDLRILASSETSTEEKTYAGIRATISLAFILADLRINEITIRTSNPKIVKAIKSAAQRAKEIHKTVPEATQRRTTIAVTETEEGIRIVSSSEKRLRPSQRKALQSGEVEGVGTGHAEVTGINAAQKQGLTPTGTAASRPICPNCVDFLKKQGVNPLSPLK